MPVKSVGFVKHNVFLDFDFDGNIITILLGRSAYVTREGYNIELEA